MRRHQKFSIQDSSQVGEVRRTINQWAQDLEFDEVICGEISIVIAELATNILKHAKEGEIITSLSEYSLDIIAIDSGPGIENVSQALGDGYSTHGTAGNGLGAIKRLSDDFDVYSVPGQGTIVSAVFRKKETPSQVEFFGFSLPVKGEKVSGDNWTEIFVDQKNYLMISDGLGHGLLAHEASLAAVSVFEGSDHHNPLMDIQNLHNGLRGTRGAAISVAYVNPEKKILEYCGLGNILGSIVSHESSKRLISYNGTVGVQLRKTQTLPYPINSNSVVVFQSDGLTTHWNILEHPGLIVKHPLIIAAFLYQKYSRGNDDVTVVVGRFK